MNTNIDSTNALTRLSFGSCFYHVSKKPDTITLWDRINEKNPEAWLWIGDSIYLDHFWQGTYYLPEHWSRKKFEKYVNRQYKKVLNNPGYQRFIKGKFITGVMDDHDFAFNDSEGSFIHKDISKSSFLQFLGGQEYNRRIEREGVYQAYEWGPNGKKVKIIMLDSRWFRNNEANWLLGDVQWEWLSEQLDNKDECQYHLLVSPIAVLNPEKEAWLIKSERRRLMELLYAKKPKGLVILSGDIHKGEIVEKDGLTEITSSGLNLDRCPIPNFGMLEFEWAENQIDNRCKLNLFSSLDGSSLGITILKESTYGDQFVENQSMVTKEFSVASARFYQNARLMLTALTILIPLLIVATVGTIMVVSNKNKKKK